MTIPKPPLIRDEYADMLEQRAVLKSRAALLGLLPLWIPTSASPAAGVKLHCAKSNNILTRSLICSPLPTKSEIVSDDFPASSNSVRSSNDVALPCAAAGMSGFSRRMRRHAYMRPLALGDHRGSSAT